jgi:signal transduction histidine kinase
LRTSFDYLIGILAKDPMAPQVATLLEMRDNFLWLLIFMQIALTTITFLISVFMSHKIAGPVFKLKKFFREAREGNLSQELYFYEKDYFQDLVPEYNSMMQVIRERIESDETAISQCIALVESAIVKGGPEVQEDLQLALETLTQAVQPEKSE